MARAIVPGLLVPGGTEAVQLGASAVMGFPYRVADGDDVVLNTAGTVHGFAALPVAGRGARPVVRRARGPAVAPSVPEVTT